MSTTLTLTGLLREFGTKTLLPCAGIAHNISSRIDHLSIDAVRAVDCEFDGINREQLRGSQTPGRGQVRNCPVTDNEKMISNPIPTISSTSETFSLPM